MNKSFVNKLAFPLIMLDTHMILRSPPPRTKYKTPLGHKTHPKIHPESPPQTKIQKKKRKMYENPRFSYIFRIFSVFWFREGIRGVFWGVFCGPEGFCILYGAEEISISYDMHTHACNCCWGIFDC